MVDSRAFGRRGPRIPHLVQAGKGGLAGEVADLRADVEAACHYIETTLQPMVLEEFTNLAAADTDAFKTAAATSASIQTFTVDDLDGVVGAAEVSPPRNATITSSTHANIDAVAVVITGYVRDDRGDLIAQTDTITLTDGGGATDVGTKAFSKITGISVPAQGGTGGNGSRTQHGGAHSVSLPRAAHRHANGRTRTER